MGAAISTSGSPRRGARIVVLAVALLFSAAGDARAEDSAVTERIAAASVFRVKVFTDATRPGPPTFAGFDVAGRSLDEGWTEVITDRDGLLRLVERELRFEIIEEREVGRSSDDGRTQIASVADAAYTDPAELETFLAQVESDHPDIVRLEVIGTSIQGRPIRAMMISQCLSLISTRWLR